MKHPSTFAIDQLRHKHATEVLRLRRVLSMLMLWAEGEPTLEAIESWWRHEDPRSKRRATLAARRLLMSGKGK